MRHKIAGRRLGRDSEHHLAMRRNMVASLFEHETISTTIEKAKEIKPFAEKMITLAKKGTLAARRRAIAELGDRDILTEQDGQSVKKGRIISKLFSEIGPRYLDRPGGYTRIIRLSQRRLGDNGQLVLLQLVGQQETSAGKAKKVVKADTSTKQEPEEVVEAIEVTEQAEENTEETESGKADTDQDKQQ